MVKTVLIQLPGGVQFPPHFPASTLMESVIHEVFSGPEYPRISFLDTRGSAIVDIGVNIRCSALLFATHYPDATVYALEPATETFGFLSRNMASHRNVRPLHLGAYNADTTARFFPGKAASVTGSLVSGGEAADVPGETVRLRRISTLLRELHLDRIALLKVDTEGAELGILTDLVDFFDRIDAIYLEYHSEADRLAIDQLLSSQYTLISARSNCPHRGICGYCAKRVLSAKTNYELTAIRPPVIE